MPREIVAIAPTTIVVVRIEHRTKPYYNAARFLTIPLDSKPLVQPSVSGVARFTPHLENEKAILSYSHIICDSKPPVISRKAYRHERRLDFSASAWQ
jgi:hypothetical protein